MKNIKFLLVLLFLSLTVSAKDEKVIAPEEITPEKVAPVKMTPEKMITIIKTVAKKVQSKGNLIKFVYKNEPVMIIFDTNADRMRVIAVVAKVETVTQKELQKAMSANFHKTIDARYAVNNGILWSAFIHPLSDLSETLLKSAISQVVTAKINFGTSYSSGNLVFGGGE